MFTNVADSWNVSDVCARTQTAAIIDANHDGYPDVMVGNTASRVDPTDPCDNPANGFTNKFNKLYINHGGTRLVDESDTYNLGSMNAGISGIEVADVNHDGWQDFLYVGDGMTRLYINTHGSFTDVTAQMVIDPLLVAAHFADINHDGWQDIIGVTATSARSYINRTGAFTTSQQVAATTKSIPFHAVAVGDFNGDGADDIYLLRAQSKANPDDWLLLEDPAKFLNFSQLTAPSAAGYGDSVFALHPDTSGRANFLVLNGRAIPGPIQLLSSSK